MTETDNQTTAEPLSEADLNPQPNHGGVLAALRAELERDYDACSARGANGRAARCRAWLAALDAALAVVGAAKRYTEDSQWCEEFEEALARFFGEGAEPSGGGGK